MGGDLLGGLRRVPERPYSWVELRPGFEALRLTNGNKFVARIVGQRSCDVPELAGEILVYENALH